MVILACLCILWSSAFDIIAAKKVNLADVGIVGLTDGSEEKEKGPPPSFYMGRAMGTGSGLGKSGFPSASSEGDDFFSSLSSQQYQFGGFKKWFPFSDLQKDPTWAYSFVNFFFFF